MEKFKWRGEDILDINEWAKDRNEQMIQYKRIRRVPSPPGQAICMELEEGEMPESFWNNLVISNGWHYTELGRRDV